ncbi:MAG: S8 family serine peptidase [Chitinophagaceae bacterium]|nr:S8 family serine peptidase [Chitinophagaceae bacterium]
MRIKPTRLYHLMKDEYENKTFEFASLNNDEKAKYELWQKINKKLTMSEEDQFNYKIVKATAQALARQDTILQKAFGKTTYSIAELEKSNFEEESARRAKFGFLRTAQMLQFEPDKTNTDLFEELNAYLEQQEGLMNAKTSPFVNYRALIGDNPDDISDRNYGNPDIMGPEAKHGTHVAGIIAAKRNNNTGMDGVANNVQILTLRAVPDGDEYDKDIALAIRYAADNGAKVINMSFGKDFSPKKEWVDDAIRYAASKDVLLVHAAGNDSKNIDENDNFPSALMNDKSVAANMITVGASGDSSIKTGMIAPFTNYGKVTVDVLAPGVKIYSTVPTGNRYSFQEGTSMAAPVVSGIAALIRGYYPQLSAAEVKQILMQSVDKTLSNQLFSKPGSDDETITMAELCGSGGIVNAYNALVLADKMASQKK